MVILIHINIYACVCSLMLYYSLIVIRSCETIEKTVLNLPNTYYYYYQFIYFCFYKKKTKILSLERVVRTLEKQPFSKISWGSSLLLSKFFTCQNKCWQCFQCKIRLTYKVNLKKSFWTSVGLNLFSKFVFSKIK